MANRLVRRFAIFYAGEGKDRRVTSSTNREE
jgi:hypothetical protein